MLLDSRYFRLDDLLRQPLRAGMPLCSPSRLLQAAPPLAWGFADGVRWQSGPALGALTLTLAVNDTPLLPAEGHWRPSHVSLYGQDADTGLQVVEDKLIAAEDTLVVSLTLRNPSAETVFVAVELAWGLREGSGAWGWVQRCAPALDERYFQLPAGASSRLAITLGIAPEEEQAWKRATRWFFDPRPAATQAQRLDDWRALHAPLFDAADPWLTRLVAYSQVARWRGESLPLPPGSVRPRACFPGDDFDALPEPAYAWDRYVLEELVGAHHTDTTLHLTPNNTLALSSFCLQGMGETTLVWDDPAHPEDAYQDGDKGLTVYHGRRRIYNQSTLAPCQIPLPAPARFGKESG